MSDAQVLPQTNNEHIIEQTAPVIEHVEQVEPSIEDEEPFTLTEKPIEISEASIKEDSLEIHEEPVKEKTIEVNEEPVVEEVSVEQEVPVEQEIPVEKEVPVKVDAPVETPVETPNVNVGNDFDKDPCSFVKTKVESLVYWENPKNSAIFLAGSFGLLTLARYYSALQILTGLFTLTTGLNWIYVNLHQQSQRVISNKRPEEIVNPHRHRFVVNKSYIPRERVLRVTHFLLDASEVVIEQATKLVLVQDNSRSLLAFVGAFFVWTLSKCVSTTNILATLLVLAFSLPRLYSNHKELVDTHVAKHSKTARSLAEQYGVTKMFS